MKDDPHAKQSVFPPLCSPFCHLIALFPVTHSFQTFSRFSLSLSSHFYPFFSLFIQSLFHLYRMRINISDKKDYLIVIRLGNILFGNNGI